MAFPDSLDANRFQKKDPTTAEATDKGYTVGGGRRANEKLINALPRLVTVRRNGQESELKAEELLAREVIVIRPGERIPLQRLVEGLFGGVLILSSLAGVADGCLRRTPGQTPVDMELHRQQNQIAQKTPKITKALGINRASTGFLGTRLFASRHPRNGQSSMP